MSKAEAAAAGDRRTTSDSGPVAIGLGLAPPPVAPESDGILTLSAEEVARFFLRKRRDDEEPVHDDVRLDAVLHEILERANDFVPSEAGGILIDDPRAAGPAGPTARLTFIAVYGPGWAPLLGARVPTERGFIGEVYRGAAAVRSDRLLAADPLLAIAPGRADARPVESVIGVPVTIGDRVCGVLQLVNRGSGGPYTAHDAELLGIFAAYMSSSIQVALDAIRATALARLDHLTGLFNSRYFHNRLQDEIARADKDNGDLALLFLDLDHFKTINDRFGHLAGSSVLRQIARRLSEGAPPASVVARYGGDEFVVALPGTPLPRALAIAEQLRTAIADTELYDLDASPGPPAPLPRVHASIGVASYRVHLAPGGNPRRRENRLLSLADTAMYRAKAAGRDRVETAEAEE